MHDVMRAVRCAWLDGTHYIMRKIFN